jgi:hypothetical protein
MPFSFKESANMSTFDNTPSHKLPSNIIHYQHLLLAMRGVGECMRDAADLALMGPERFGGNIKRGGVAVGLEKAAYMILFGTMEGFKDNTASPPPEHVTAPPDTNTFETMFPTAKLENLTGAPGAEDKSIVLLNEIMEKDRPLAFLEGESGGWAYNDEDLKSILLAAMLIGLRRGAEIAREQSRDYDTNDSQEAELYGQCTEISNVIESLAERLADKS